MLSYRQIKIISYILSLQKGISLIALMNVIGVSEKTLKNEIKQINKTLFVEDAILYTQKKGFFIENPSDKLYRILNTSYQNSKEDYGDKDRKNRIFILLLNEKNYISMETLATKLHLSKSMLNKIMDASWRLRHYIEVSPTKGLRIPWDEGKKRDFLAKLTVDPSNFEFFNQEKEVLIISDILYQILCTNILEYHYIVSGNALKTFHNYLLATIVRRKEGFYLTEEVPFIPISNLMRKIYYQIQTELNTIFNEQELLRCQHKLNELNLLHYDKGKDFHESRNDLLLKLQVFTSKLKDRFGIPIVIPSDVLEMFLIHMHKLRIRIENGNDVANFNKRDINTNYPFTAQIIRDIFLPVFDIAIKDTEISYIILYFAKYIEYTRPKCEVLLVSDATPSLIHDTIYKIERLFIEYEIRVTAIPLYQYVSNSDLYDVEYATIITTEFPIITMNYRALLVNSFIEQEDIQLVQLYIKGCIVHNNEMKLENNKRRFMISETIHNDKKGNIFDFLPHSKLGLFITYDIVLNVPIGYFANFVDTSSEIVVYNLENPILYKDTYLHKIIIANYNDKEGSYSDFYQVVHYLLLEK